MSQANDKLLRQALDLLAGLHPCLTVSDDDPIGQAETIFAAVQSEIREIQQQRDDALSAVEWLRAEFTKLRVIASYVPALVYIDAKERAGHGTRVMADNGGPMTSSHRLTARTER